MVLIIRTERLNNPNRLLSGIIVRNIRCRIIPINLINGVYSKSLMVKVFE